MNTEVLATFPNSIDAHLLRAKLESEGIRCFLVNETFSDMLPIYYGLLGAGVQVVIGKEDMDKAREYHPTHAYKVICPSCGSEHIHFKYAKIQRKLVLLFVGLILSSLIGNLLLDSQCDDCNAEFKAI